MSKLSDDYKIFLDQKNYQVPDEIYDRTRALVRAYDSKEVKGLNVFLKVVASQAIAGIVSLLFCPQFGVGAWLDSDHMGIMHYFMHWGDIACALVCASTWFVIAAVFSVFLLSPVELVRAKKYYMNAWLFGVAASFGALMMTGADAALLPALAWWGAAMIMVGVVVILGQLKLRLV